MGRKRWELCKPDKDFAAKLAEEYSLDPFAALLLSERGLKEESELDAFFDTEGELIDPFLLPDMEKAVDRINDAIFDLERICVFGDYDADGVTATAVLYSYLDAQGADAVYMLPDRETDGYGLSRNVVDRIHALGTKLIVTVDNGIAAVEEANYIKELGMELIVTDHHLPGEKRPDCVAIVDPHLPEVSVPFRDYCGAGVAFKLCCAIEGNAERIIEDYIDLVAIGTIADLVPLTGENRKLAKLGLASLNAYRRPGIEALAAVAGIKGKMVSHNVSFGIAPRINAAGRMESAELALDLLLVEDPSEAAHLAGKLDELNNLRHKAEQEIFNHTVVLLKEYPTIAHEPVLVVYGEQWQEGVLGIVASKLIGRYMRPAIVLTKKGDTYKGSCRSVEGFNIYEALDACKDLLQAYGGHELAAGMTVHKDNLEAFMKAINAYAYEKEHAYPVTRIDCKLLPEAVSLSLLDAVDLLEPFGTNNPSPVFGLFRMVVDNIHVMGDNGQHRRLTVYREDKPNVKLNVVRFSVPHFPYGKGETVDLICTLNRNAYNGVQNVSTVVQDIRPSGVNEDEMVYGEGVFDKICARHTLTPEEADYAFPEREVVGALYKLLRRGVQYDMDAYEYLLYKTPEKNNLCRTRVALAAMLELGLIALTDEGLLTVPKTENKVDLQTAPILLYLNQYRGEGR